MQPNYPQNKILVSLARIYQFNTLTMIHRSVRIVFSLVLLIVFSFPAMSQETKEKIMISPEGDTTIIKAVALSQITSHIENAYDKIKTVKKVLANNQDLNGFDSLYLAGMKYLEEEKDKINKKADKLTLIEIDNLLKQWHANQEKANQWKEKIQKRLKTLNSNKFLISVLKEQSVLTYNDLRKSGVPNKVLTSISELIINLKDIEKEIKAEQNKTLAMQNNITKVLLFIDQIMTGLNKAYATVQSDYLRQDSPPLWKSSDSTVRFQSTKLLIRQALDSNWQSVKLFVDDNKNMMIFHLVLLFIIWGLFYLLFKQLDLIDESNEDVSSKAKLEIAKEVISRHISAALIFTLFLSLWLYPPMITTIGKVIQFVYIILAIILLPGFTGKKIKPFLYTILILFLINLFHIMIPGKTLFTRSLMLVESFIVIWVLYKVIHSVKFFSENKITGQWGFFAYLIPIFLLLVAGSFIGNIIGYVNISILWNNAVIDALINFIVLIIAVMVFSAAFTILIRMPFALKSNLLRNHFAIIDKRIRQIIRIIGIWLWLKSMLEGLSIYGAIYNWFTGLFSISWGVGKTTIELGGIINFFIIITLTYYVTKFIKTVLNEEVFPRIRLPRGVPGAITMITGYFIAGYGIFLAIAAMGVDLGKFGLLAGALGVGIGFGLQGIVANFIAGLVLAFERPIQVGDTIEVNGMMGDVTNIGVRSSSIRTFDGSEVIIPNSTLITNDVTNWTLSDRKKRRDINVGVAYGTDPHQVMEIIKKVANEHPNVLKTPAPWALFDGFGESSLNFRIRIWTTMDTGMTTKSDVAMAIYDALKEAGIQIPFPQHDLHLKSIDPEIEKVNV